ncbi:MAG: hypothetical protein SGBAC_000944 [Bacillariaceae sp.]
MRSFVALFLLPSASAFAPTQLNTHSIQHVLQMASFEMEVDIPPSDSNVRAALKFDPILEVPSEIVEVRYSVPFGLNVEPEKNLAVCTKDGEGGEKVGDVLRYTSQWTLGLPRGDGLVTTAAMFAGGVSWGCSLFDVMSAKSWEQVVEALVSNVESRTDEVVLLFERPLEPEK